MNTDDKSKPIFNKNIEYLTRIALHVLVDNKILTDMFVEHQIDFNDILIQAENKVSTDVEELQDMIMDLYQMSSMTSEDADNILNKERNPIHLHWEQQLTKTALLASSFLKMKDTMINLWAKQDVSDVQLIVYVNEVIKKSEPKNSNGN